MAKRVRNNRRRTLRAKPETSRSFWSILIAKFYNLPTLQVVAGAVLILIIVSIVSEPDLTWAEKISLRRIIGIPFNSAESIAIISAVVIYFKETPDRKIRQQSELFNIFASSAKFPNTQVRAIVLEKLNSQGVPLGVYDFSDIDSLSGINLPNADLSEANFQDVNLRGANLQTSLLCKSIFKSAKLQTANLYASNLWRANLEGAILTNADLANANLSESNLFGADIQGASLEGAYLRNANLCNAKLQKANLSGADLGEADLTGANLKHANLTGANLQRAYFDDTTMPNGLVWDRAVRDTW